jgi:lysozyme family protein
MDRYEDAIHTILANEGGYVFDSADPGGETNYGICRRQYPHLNIPALTREQAREIYRRDYWFCDSIHDQAVATKLFDMAVNMGRNTAVRLLQRALLALGNTAVITDGIFGPATLALTNASPADLLLAALRHQAADRYRALVEKNPKLLKFLHGWLARAAQ